MFRENLEALISLMEDRGLDKVVLSGFGNTSWISGLRLESLVVSVSRDGGVRFYVPVLEYYRAVDHADSLEFRGSVEVVAYQRYPLEPPEDVRVFSGGLSEVYSYEVSGSRVGCDLAYVSGPLYGALSSRCVDVSDDLSRVRSVKNSREIEAIRRSAEIAVSAFRRGIGSLSGSSREVDLAVEIENTIRSMGGDPAFSVIVASGLNSVYPHAKPGFRTIDFGGPVTVDLGALYGNYCSDMTRVIVSRLASGFREAVEAVSEALDSVLDNIAPGTSCRELDSLARRVLGRFGLARFFIHALGHGVGVEVHESPRLSPGSGDTLTEGMVVTVEPGVYVRGRFGVRLEELVLVSSSGPVVLTSGVDRVVEVSL